MSLKPFLQAVGMLAIVLTIFPFVAADFWWIRMFDYPHVQLTIFTLVALLVYFFRFDIRNWRDYAFIVLLSACFVFQLLKIYPYTPFSSLEVKENLKNEPSQSLSLLAINVLQKNTEYSRVVDEVLRLDPDVIVFTETSRKWSQALQKGLAGFGYEFRVEKPLENTYGMLLYSKLPLIQPEVRFLAKDSTPSIHTQLRLRSGALIQMHIIHPTPPMPPHDASSTGRDAQMMMVAEMARKAAIPVIVTGDFNDVAWSETTSLFQEVAGVLDPRRGRGFYNTYNANSWFMRWPLDHLFVSEEFRLIDLQLGKDVESDHFPLYAKLSLEPQNKKTQTPENPSPEELNKAQKQVENEH